MLQWGQLVGPEHPQAPTCCEACGRTVLPCMEGGAEVAQTFPGPGCSVLALGMHRVKLQRAHPRGAQALGDRPLGPTLPQSPDGGSSEG